MSDQSILTSENVERLLKSMLISEGDPIPAESESTIARGITANVRFCTAKVTDHREEIRMMLDELPKQFRQSHGGGWTFLNMVTRRDGSQWGEQQQAEWLLLMGLAAGLIKYLVPKDSWNIFPGRVPYLVYLDTPSKNK